MNAMEKAAWTELGVCVGAIAVVTLLVPWLGNQATAGFAVLSLLVSVVFTRQRNNRVVIDERDREIERKATSVGVGTAWMMLFTALALATAWSGYSGTHAVSTVFLNWLIWVQFATCYGVKGLAAIVMYRRRPHAA